MTLHDVLEEKNQDTLLSRNACCGYAIAAMEENGVAPDVIQRVLASMSEGFSWNLPEEMETKYIEY